MSKTEANKAAPASEAAQGDTAASAASVMHLVSPEQVSDAIKRAGCAVTAIEQDGVVRLHSASHGIGFQVLWGNAVAPSRYADFVLSCPLRIQGGSLPAGVLTEWHRTRRFARISQHGDFVVLEMDVVAAGGIGADYLPTALRLWTQMMGEFFLYLRNFRPAADAAAAAAPAVEQAAAATPAA
jgi:hypothetical protein